MLDEPFSALDSYLREEVEGEVGALLDAFAGTALLVTHNRDEAYRLCPKMIVMDRGQVLRAGTTKEVFADPRTCTAAQLTGCKNILPFRVGDPAASGGRGAGALHRHRRSRPRFCPLCPGCRKRPAGARALLQRKPLRLEPDLRFAGRLRPPVVESLETNPDRIAAEGSGCTCGRPGEHHAAAIRPKSSEFV